MSNYRQGWEVEKAEEVTEERRSNAALTGQAQCNGENRMRRNPPFHRCGSRYGELDTRSSDCDCDVCLGRVEMSNVEILKC